jgi:hypothetical protein
MRRYAFQVASFAAASLLVGGCGGGSSSAGGGSGTLQTSVVGFTKATYTGHATPDLSVSSSGVTVTGLGGASITSLVVQPNNSLNQTNIATARNGQVWDLNVLTGVETEISNLPGNAGLSGGPSFGKNVVVFATTAGNLYACYYDGSSNHQVTPGTNSVTQHPAYSGNYIAGYDSSGDLVVEGAGGGKGTILVPHTSLDVVGQVAWLGSALTVVFQEPVSGTEQLFEIPFTVSGTTITPGAAVRVPNFSNTVSGAYDLETAVNATGTAVAWDSTVGSGNSTISVTNIAASGSNTTNITQGGLNYYYPSFSPDGTMISVVGQAQGEASNDGSFGLYTMLVDGENPQLVGPDPSGASGPTSSTSMFSSWSPFPGYERLVGSGGLLGTAVSGFLQSQVGDAIGSAFTYTVTTPSTVVVTPATTSSSSSPTLGALVFTIAADSINNIAWNNGYSLAANTSLATTGATNVVVSFSGTTGALQYAAPLTGSGAKTAISAPTMTKTATAYVYKGHFSAIYDGTGKNIAPSGASMMEIDQKTGQLVNWN